jgi:oligopeptide transport system permease protein
LEDNKPPLAPLGTPDPPDLYIGPEYAIAEKDVGEVISGEVLAGTSLWRDAWRRLMKNKLAVLGMIIVMVIVIAAVIGPTIIKQATGYAYDFIPKDQKLTKSFPPFRGPDGRFSWIHPMGTDNAGRDMLARVLSGGQISLMVALIATIVSLLIGVSYGATAGYVGGRIDDLMMRVVDVLYSLPYVIIVIVLLALLPAKTPTGQLAQLFLALGAVSWLTMARIVRGQVMSLKNQEFILAARRPRKSSFVIWFRTRSVR